MDIKLIVDANSFTLYSTRNADKKFQTFKKKVLERDRYTCSYCGFRSKIHMSVINMDANYLNNKISNLVTACPYCAQCHFLPYVGKVNNTGGTLIHLPDMSQAQLNALCHTIFCLIHNDTKHSKLSDKVYKSLKLRGQVIEDYWGNDLSDPSMLAQMMIDTPGEKVKAVKSSLLKDIRLLPSIKAFKQQISDWSMNALNQGISGPY